MVVAKGDGDDGLTLEFDDGVGMRKRACCAGREVEGIEKRAGSREHGTRRSEKSKGAEGALKIADSE